MKFSLHPFSIWLGHWGIVMPRDVGQEFANHPKRSYLYLIKNDFRDERLKVKIRR